MNYRHTKQVKPFPEAQSQWLDEYPGGPLYLPDGYGNSLSFLGWDCYARAGTFHDAGCVGRKIWWWDTDHWESSIITSWISQTHVQVTDAQGETSGFPYVTRWGRVAATVADVAAWLHHTPEHLVGLRAAGVLPYRSVIRWGYLWSEWWEPVSPWTNWPLTTITI